MAIIKGTGLAMQKVFIVMAISIILLAVLFGGFYLQFQIRFASLEGKYSELDTSYLDISEKYVNLNESCSELLANYEQLSQAYSNLTHSYNFLKDLAENQHFQRESARVLVYAWDFGGVMLVHGNEIIEALEQDPRIAAVLATDPSNLTLANLEANFDSVVLYQHNEPGYTTLLSYERIADLINFAESGHMLVVVHHGIYDPNRANTDPNYNIIPLTDYVGGYLGDVSTSRKPPLLDGIEDNFLVVVNSTHYLSEGVSNFTIENDEVYYALVTSPDIVTVIKNRDFGPFVWSRGDFGVYIQMGHFPSDFDHPMMRRLLQNAVLHFPIT